MSISPPTSIRLEPAFGNFPALGKARPASAPGISRLDQLRNIMLLAGKKVVVVGGSSGIGLSTAELAKREGAEVVIASRSAAKLDAAASKLGVKAIAADVTSDDSVANLFKQCGAVDHVVVSAAQLK